MYDRLQSLFRSLKDNNISSFNYVKSRQESLCINFLNIPQSDLVAITISVMFNRKKKAELDAVSFAKLMGKVEIRLTYISESYGVDDSLCFLPIIHRLSFHERTSWYRTLEAHRVFLIPTTMVFSTLECLTESDFIEELMHDCKLNEVTYYINTSEHKLKVVKMK